MRSCNLIVGALLVSSIGLVPLVRAAAAPTTQASEAADSADMQHLRDARKLINEAKDAFDKDPVDKANHRKEILDGIHASIKAIDDEIDELKAEAKK